MTLSFLLLALALHRRLPDPPRWRPPDHHRGDGGTFVFVEFALGDICL